MTLKPFLRHGPDDPEQTERDLEAALAAAAEARASGNRLGLLRSLGRVGNACQLLDRSEEAIPHLEAALDLAQAMDRPRDAIANRIRLGIAWQYGGHAEMAEQILRGALAEAQALSFYEDFALQHLGKLLVEAGRLTEAVPLFERAWALREANGDPSLIQSTQEALAHLSTLMQVAES